MIMTCILPCPLAVGVEKMKIFSVPCRPRMRGEVLLGIFIFA